MEYNNENINNSDLVEMPVRTSKMAISSLILGILGFVIPLIVAFIGLILGIICLRRINNKKDALKGGGIAIAGSVVSGVSLVLWLLLILVYLSLLLYAKASIPVFQKTGGYSVTCQVGDGEPLDNSTIQEVCKILHKRIDPVSVHGILIEKQDNNYIEIRVPVTQNQKKPLDDPENLIGLLKGAGTLEFRILPIGEEGRIAELNAYREKLAEKGPGPASDSQYVWCEIEEPETFNTSGIVGAFGEKNYILCSNQVNETMLQDSNNKWKLNRAYPTIDAQGRRAIGFVFDEIAGNKFFNLTSENLSRPLCILLDGKAVAAPTIYSAIRSTGVITGSFSDEEVSGIVNKLNAGVLPVPVRAKTESIQWISIEE